MLIRSAGAGMMYKVERIVVNVPFNTGKVLIGSHYVKPPQRMELSRDMELLQTALLKFKLQPKKGKSK